MSMMAPEEAGMGAGLEALLGGGGGLPTAGPPAPEMEVPADEPLAAEGESSDPSDLVRQALDLLRKALEIEPDDEDTLLLEKMTTQGQQYLAAQQKLGDQAMGAGPGEKFLRKSGNGGSAGGGY
jgi:hypothetical protein